MPDRTKLSRAKGWRMPENTVKVDRTTIWGNPWKLTEFYRPGRNTPEEAQAEAVRMFRAAVEGFESNGSLCKPIAHPDSRIGVILARLPELRGKNLACWCKTGTPCHADVLLEIANGPYPEDGWLIHKAGRGWYNPGAWGYTLNPAEAGRFSRVDAMRHSHPNGPTGPRDGMKIFHESEVANA